MVRHLFAKTENLHFRGVHSRQNLPVQTDVEKNHEITHWEEIRPEYFTSQDAGQK
ncbi:hypothetical protein ACFL6N_00160 [Thermodesulfobacteriota bacterium]